MKAKRYLICHLYSMRGKKRTNDRREALRAVKKGHPAFDTKGAWRSLSIR